MKVLPFKSNSKGALRLFKLYSSTVFCISNS